MGNKLLYYIQFKAKIIALSCTLFLLILPISSCSSYSQKALERKAKHQAGTGARINESQKNTDSLFDEMQ